MRLWTTTDQACWLAAKRRGFFVNDKSFVDPHLAKSYDWMHARFRERCKRNAKFVGTDSLVWCRKDFDENAIRLKPVTAAADEWVLVFLNVVAETVRLRIEVLEDIHELSDPYHELTLGPINVRILPDEDTCSVQLDLHVPNNPAVIKLRLFGPDQPEVYGDYVKVELISTDSMWDTQQWQIRNFGHITACSKSLFTKRWHRILVEFEMPDEEVLLSSEQAFTVVINNISNDRHDFINWTIDGRDETNWDDYEWSWPAPREECFENYKGIFNLDELKAFAPGDAYDIQGVVEGIPMSAIRSVWHTYDGKIDYWE